MQHPKPSREIDRKYLDFVRGSARCAIALAVGHRPCVGPTDVAHLRSRGAGGSDYQVVALCRKAHSEQHTIGLKRFQERYSIDLYAIAADLYRRWKA